MTRMPEPQILSAKAHQRLKADVCIVGAGVTGSALAAMLGENGLSVIVVEKDLRSTERIVGELLQPDGVKKLREMGLSDCLEEIDAQIIRGYYLRKGEASCTIPYPEHAESGRAFHHHLFIDRLRGRLRSCERIQLLEARVLRLNEKQGRITGAEARDTEGLTWVIEAPLTILSDGMQSTLRAQYHQNTPERTGYFIGLILKNCPLPSPGHGHVFLTESSPYLCYPISSGEIRMLVDFRGESPPRKGSAEVMARFSEVEKTLPDVLLPAFREAVGGRYFKVMPNHRLPAEGFKRQKGLTMIGDALNMRHPLTGGGMTAGLTGACQLGKAILQLSREGKWGTAEADQRINRMPSAPNAPINILADALYAVFRHPQLSAACIAYLQSSPFRARGPVQLLAGLSRSRRLLYYHFFAVAFFGAFRRGSGLSLTRRWELIKDARNILRPLIG